MLVNDSADQNDLIWFQNRLVMAVIRGDIGAASPFPSLLFVTLCPARATMLGRKVAVFLFSKTILLCLCWGKSEFHFYIL